MPLLPALMDYTHYYIRRLCNGPNNSSDLLYLAMMTKHYKNVRASTRVTPSACSDILAKTSSACLSACLQHRLSTLQQISGFSAFVRASPYLNRFSQLLNQTSPTPRTAPPNRPSQDLLPLYQKNTCWNVLLHPHLRTTS